MLFIVSCIPMIVIVLCIFVFKKSSIVTGITALITTGCLVMLPSFNSNTFHLSHPFIKGSLTTLSIAYILLFGIFLFQLMEQAGAIQGLSKVLKSATPDPFYQLLLLVLGFSPLIESISGFGLAVIIIAPILLALGIAPKKAALLALISLCIIPWGTLSMGTIIGAALSNLELQHLGVWSAIVSLPLYVYIAFLAIGIGVGWKVACKRWREIVWYGLVLGGAVLGCNLWISVELAGIFGAFVLMGAILIRIRKSVKLEIRSFMYFLTPYILLIVLLFCSRTITNIKQFLMEQGTWTVEAFQYSFAVFYSPGFFLIIISVFTIFFYKLNAKKIAASAWQTWEKCMPILLSTFLYICVAELMTSAKMITILSTTIASLIGPPFLYISPVIGAMGGFLTGSNTASNTMLIRLQTETANYIGINKVHVAAAQNVSSSFSTMINPSKIALSCSVCHISNKENVVQMKMLKIGGGTIGFIIIILACIQYI